MKILLWIVGVSLAWRWAARQPKRVKGGGITGEALSFTAPDDSTAADVLLALSKAGVPIGVTYRIDWIAHGLGASGPHARKTNHN